MKSITVKLPDLSDVNVPLPEDDRPSIPSDPLFVQAVIEEGNKTAWEVALDRWFYEPTPVEVITAKYEFLMECGKQAAKINAEV